MTLPGRFLTYAELAAYNRWLNTLTVPERAKLKAEARLARIARMKERKAILTR